MCENDRELLETRRFRIVEVRQPLADGSTGCRQIIRHPGAVTIIPLIDERRVCLIRSFRVSVQRTLVELPAGTLEPDEPPLECARRELAEETGYLAKSLRFLHAFYLSPGILDERMQLFVAEGLNPGASAREPGEMIENLVVDWQEALEMVFNGEIQDAKTIVGLLFYDRWRRPGLQ